MKKLLFLPIFLVGSVWCMEETRLSIEPSNCQQNNENPPPYDSLRQDSQEQIQSRDMDYVRIKREEYESAMRKNRTGGCVAGIASMGATVACVVPWFTRWICYMQD